ncbi:MAG: hypothetical protein QOG42_2518 [Solirubrobacteraceae bacterium]|jgi:hypothetical protein|nr:hypothetical protein [Solirubrobacteraceae bacterium]
MSSRQYRRILVLALLLSAGALSLPRVEAAPPRNGPHRAGAAVQGTLPDLFAAVKSLWGMLKDAPPGPPAGNDPPHVPSNREGPGACPHGHM